MRMGNKIQERRGDRVRTSSLASKTRERDGKFGNVSARDGNSSREETDGMGNFSVNMFSPLRDLVNLDVQMLL